MTDVNGTLFFISKDNTHGVELWKSDGTGGWHDPGSRYPPGPGSSLPSELTNMNGTLFFVATDGQLGAELWQSNVTTDGTVRVADITTGPASSDITELARCEWDLVLRPVATERPAEP